MAAKIVEAAGSKNVESTSSPGFVNGLKEANARNTITMQDPAPRIAASIEATITSFNRIQELPLFQCVRAKPLLRLAGERRCQEYHS
jgi:hypothetical protein